MQKAGATKNEIDASTNS